MNITGFFIENIRLYHREVLCFVSHNTKPLIEIRRTNLYTVERIQRLLVKKQQNKTTYK